MNKHVVDLATLTPFDATPQDSQRLGGRLMPLGDQLALSGLGCMYIEVDPGKRAFPFHNHLGNDEMFVILEGQGKYRLGTDEIPISRGFVCAAPKGGQDTAHQIINDGDVTIKYLAISTLNDPDICEYPDSDKVLAMAIRPGKNFQSAYMKHVTRASNTVGYFDGEEL